MNLGKMLLGLVVVGGGLALARRGRAAQPDQPMSGTATQVEVIPGYEFYPKTASWSIAYDGQPSEYPWRHYVRVTEGHFTEGSDTSYAEAIASVDRALRERGYRR